MTPSNKNTAAASCINPLVDWLLVKLYGPQTWCAKDDAFRSCTTGSIICAEVHFSNAFYT
eukprot:6214182-Pleurochrysis_carterae.AAC.4